MDPKYTFTQLESNGVEASGIFDSWLVEGWIMDGTYFVHYAHDRQQLVPVADVFNLEVKNWSNHGTLDTRLNAVIRFKRATAFPKFSMKQGERWGFAMYRRHIDNIKAIQAGERFPMAGGQCIAQDVEIVYIGSDDLGYSRAAGYIK